MDPLVAARPDQRYVFLVLLRDEDEAQGLAQLLDDVVLESVHEQVAFTAPAVRGAPYFETNGVTPWAHNIPDRSEVVLLVEHSDDLAGLLYRLPVSAKVYIGLPEPSLSFRYEGSSNLHSFSASGPLDFAVQVMRDFSRPDGSDHLILFDATEAERMRVLAQDFPLQFDEKSPDVAPGPGETEFISGHSAYFGRDYQRALRHFDDALELGFADIANLHVWRGACLYELGRTASMGEHQSQRRFEEALAAFDEANKSGYSDTQAGLIDLDRWLATTFYELDRYDSAAAVYERLVTQKNNDVYLWFDLGSSRALNGQYDEALQAYDEVAKIDDQYPSLQRSRGAVLNVTGRRDEAGRALDKAIEQDPGDARAFFLRADVRHRLGKEAEALEDFREAENLGYSANGRLQVGRGGVLCALGRYLESLLEYQKALDLARNIGSNDTLSQAYEGIGYVSAQIGDNLSQASQACRESISLGTTSPTAFATLADVLNRLDLPYEAEAVIDRAILHSLDKEWRTTWRLYGVRAGIRFTLADRENDDVEARAALDDISKAKSFWKAEGKLTADECRDRARLSLLEGEAHLLLGHSGRARAAWRQAARVADSESLERHTAERCMRSAGKGSRPIPGRFAPGVTGVAVVVLAMMTWLLWENRLNSNGFAATVAVLLILPLAAYLLPLSSRLRIGGLEVDLLQNSVRLRLSPQLPILRWPNPPVTISKAGRPLFPNKPEGSVGTP